MPIVTSAESCRELSQALFGINPEMMTTDAIATRIVQLQKELSEQIALLRGNKGAWRYVLTPDILRSFSAKYRFLADISLSKNTGAVVVKLRYMPMNWLLGSSQSALSNGAVLYQTTPSYSYNFAVANSGLRVTNNTASLSATPSVQGSMRHYYGVEGEFDAIVEAQQNDRLLLNVVYNSEDGCSHPHNSGWARTFTSMCTGTNTFLNMISARRVTDVASFGKFLSLLVTWARSANVDDMYGGFSSSAFFLMRPGTNPALRQLVRGILVRTYDILKERLPTASGAAVVPPSALYEYHEDLAHSLRDALPSWVEGIKAQSALMPAALSDAHVRSDKADQSVPGSVNLTPRDGVMYLDLGIEVLRKAIAELDANPFLPFVMNLHDVAYTWLVHEGMVHSSSGCERASMGFGRVYRRACFMQALREDLLRHYHRSPTDEALATVPDLTTRLLAPRALWEAYTNKGTAYTSGWVECFRR